MINFFHTLEKKRKKNKDSKVFILLLKLFKKKRGRIRIC